MIVTTEAVVLSRRPLREFDRLAYLYTKDFGKLATRFIGVDRPRGKLKALSEPMVHGEFRLYVRRDGRMSTMTGGRIVDCHPGLRAGLDSTLAGLAMCEMLSRLTPEGSPSDKKFELIRDHLRALGASPSAWIPIAFGLRLMRLAGFGIQPPARPRMDGEIWLELQERDPFHLRELPEDAVRLSRLRQLLEDAVERELGAQLNARFFRESLARAMEPVLSAEA